MNSARLHRAALGIALALAAHGLSWAQTVVRSVPVGPAAPVAVPMMHGTSFLQTLTLSAGLLSGSLPHATPAPTISDLALPPAIVGAAIQTQDAAGPSVAVQPVAVPDLPGGQLERQAEPGAAPRIEAQFQQKLASLGLGLDAQRRAQPAETDEAEVSRSFSQGAGLFDGSKVRGGAVDAGGKVEAKGGTLAGTAGLQGRSLLDSLHRITGDNFRARGYDEARAFMYSKADHVDQDGTTGIVDPYSGLFLPGRGGEGGAYNEPGDANGDGYGGRDSVNAEHVWPQSFFDRAAPMRSDLHHLMATLAHPNSIRSNLPFGEVQGKPEYSNKGGAKMGGGVFEPPDFAKGRVARAALYFYTRYLDRNIFLAGGRQAWTPKVIETLLRWNREFPPTRFERNRNDLIEQWQGNRNPFIDDPGLADKIGLEAFGGGAYAGGGSEVHGRQTRHEPAVIPVPPSKPAPQLARGDERRGGGTYGGSLRDSQQHGRRWEKRHNKRRR